MPKSTYLANKLLDLPAGGTAYSAPANLFFSLHTGTLTAAGTGTEVSGGSYGRVQVTNNLTNFPAASGGAKSNANAVTWTTATASWGTVVSVGVWDASSAGNLLYYAPITSKTVDSGDTVSIPASNFNLTES